MARQRRGNGEGSISRHKATGGWQARVTLEDGTRKSFYGRTRAEVAAKLTEGLKAVKDDAPIPSDLLTVGAYLAEWRTGHASRIRPGTAERYRSLLDLHVMPRIGRLKLSKLDVRDLDRLFASLLGKGLSPSTVRQVRAIIGKALRDAERKGIVARNVARLTDPPKVERQAVTLATQARATRGPSALTVEQARALIATASEPDVRLGALFILAVCHGMRQGELFGLAWSDVDLEAGTLTVRNQLRRLPKVKGGPEVKAGPERCELAPPKTDRSRRSVNLSAVALEALRRHRAAQAAERLKAGPEWDASWDLVFANAVGRPLNPSNVGRSDYRPLLGRAGLPRIRFHDLRHTAATLLLQASEPPHVVSATLGHSKVSTTMNVYAHVLPDQAERIARTVDRLLG